VSSFVRANSTEPERTPNLATFLPRSQPGVRGRRLRDDTAPDDVGVGLLGAEFAAAIG
jgi:hypothetical protein